jgi:hypothetical protein
MKSLVAAVAVLAACTDSVPREERHLEDMPQLAANIDVDVGVPADPFGTPNIATGLSVLIDYAADGCYALHSSASASVDGHELAIIDGDDETCAKPSIYLDALPAPRDISTIDLRDESATYSISVARLFVNPRITLATQLAPGAVVARVDDPRAIASATVWWRSADGKQSWMKPVDASTQGELRFVIPAGTSGQGTLGIAVTIRDNDVSCVGFASCKAIVRGGGAFVVDVQ